MMATLDTTSVHEDKPGFTSDRTSERPIYHTSSALSIQAKAGQETAARPCESSTGTFPILPEAFAKETSTQAKALEQPVLTRTSTFSDTTPLKVPMNVAGGMARRTFIHKYTTPGFTAEIKGLMEEDNSKPAFKFPEDFSKRWGGYASKKAG